MIHNEISNITVHEISIKNLSGEIFLKQKKKKISIKNNVSDFLSGWRLQYTSLIVWMKIRKNNNILNS